MTTTTGSKNFSDSCSTEAMVIGNNTGVYVGGVPADYTITRIVADPREKVGFVQNRHAMS